MEKLTCCKGKKENRLLFPLFFFFFFCGILRDVVIQWMNLVSAIVRRRLVTFNFKAGTQIKNQNVPY